MAYRLEPEEAVPAGVRRVVRERIDRALDELTSPQIDRHAGVHEARKRFKEIRAVLRLMRGEIDAYVPFENAFYRDSGRKLAEARDAQAMLESLEKLRDRFADETGEPDWAPVRQVLTARLEEHASLPQTGAIVESLKEARDRVALWPLERSSFSAIEPGLRRTYAQGRRAWRLAGREPLAENFHEWRKKVKDLWYQAQLLHDLWPDLMKGFAETLKSLSRILGDDHDLAVLREILLRDTGQFGGDTGVLRLVQLIDRRRAELESDALAIGAKVYAEKPSQFARRMRSYWDG
jgi:CHAD domain-containing protein